MRPGRVFDAVFAGSVGSVLAGIVGGALFALASAVFLPRMAGGGAAAIGAVFSAVVTTPPLIGHLLGANAVRHVLTGYAFALAALLWLAGLIYFYVPAVQALPLLLAASSAAGIRYSQID